MSLPWALFGLKFLGLDETLRYRIITDYIRGANNIFVIYLSIFFCDGSVNW